MTREILSFTQILGHSEVCYRCDNEPSIRQVQRHVINARQKMGLSTCAANPTAYDHGNSLVENSIGRIRPLAGTKAPEIQLA